MNLRRGKPRINIIKDENGNLLTEPYRVLNKWKNIFNRVLNVHGVHDVRQIDTHMAEPLVLGHGLVEAKITTEKLKRYKSPGIDQILAELIKAGSEILCSEIQKLIFCMWNKEELPHNSRRNLLLHQFIRRVIRLIIIEESPSYQLPTKFYPSFFWQG
jgi:hypothetical protein